MGPEVTSKRLPWRACRGTQDGRTIRHFTTVFDVVPIKGDHRHPLRRPTPAIIFVRTRHPDSNRADGGESFYIEGDQSRHAAGAVETAHMTTAEILAEFPEAARARGRRRVPRPLVPYDPALALESRETGIPRIGVVSTK